MKVTLSVLKADIGSVGGHTLPSRKVLAKVEEVVREEVGRLLLDAPPDPRALYELLPFAHEGVEPLYL
jgi:hypothetical protein